MNAPIDITILTRRQALAGIAAAPAAVVAVPAASEPHDPLVDAVEAYWKSIALFDHHNLHNDDEIDEYANLTYWPRLQVLHKWDNAAVSREGAITALRFVVKESGNFWVSDGVGAMIKAALGYLDRESVS